jgi:hydrogenase maturation protease
MDKLAEPALVVFAWGNASRGDDGIGPRMADHIRDYAHPRVELIEDHQLNIEHVTDIRERTPVLFIDASVALDDGFEFERLVPSGDGNFSTHAISPKALLNVYCETMQSPAPDSFLLHIAGRQFNLGDGLSHEADAAVRAAWSVLQGVLDRPENEWSTLIGQAVARLPAQSVTSPV